jgi:hypothetical protein
MVEKYKNVTIIEVNTTYNSSSEIINNLDEDDW